MKGEAEFKEEVGRRQIREDERRGRILSEGAYTMVVMNKKVSKNELAANLERREEEDDKG